MVLYLWSRWVRTGRRSSPRAQGCRRRHDGKICYVGIDAGAAEAWRCAKCGLERRKPQKRLPRGWKRLRDEAHCQNCWRERYILRAIIIPVVAPLNCSWEVLLTALHNMWTATTQVSNWMLTQLYSRDVRKEDAGRMPPMPRVYLYPEARARFPTLPSQSIAAIENTVQTKYRAVRYKVNWICTASLPVYRYPHPFPVPNQAWHLALEGQALVLSVPIGEKRLRLRLEAGPRFRRQQSAAERIVSGEGVKGELAIYQAGTAILCKMVAWLPREERTEAYQGILYVRTMKESLLGAMDEKSEALVYHGDHIRRWVARHRKQLERWSQDQSAERRPNPPLGVRRRAAASKYHDRLTSACHEISAMIAGYAERRKFAEVRYDDTVHIFCPEFPWYELRVLVNQKLDGAGIRFVHIDGDHNSLAPHAIGR